MRKALRTRAFLLAFHVSEHLEQSTNPVGGVWRGRPRMLTKRDAATAVSSRGCKDTGQVRRTDYCKEDAALQTIFRMSPGGEAAETLRTEVQNELVSFPKPPDYKVLGSFLQTNETV